MTEDPKTRRGWEHQFPGVSEEWTHWWIEGDGALIGVVSGSDMSAALDVVARYHQQRRWIIVYLAKLDSAGEAVRDDTRRFEIEGRNKFGR